MASTPTHQSDRGVDRVDVCAGDVGEHEGGVQLARPQWNVVEVLGLAGALRRGLQLRHGLRHGKAVRVHLEVLLAARGPADEALGAAPHGRGRAVAARVKHQLEENTKRELQ